jgi:hypothetical protein
MSLIGAGRSLERLQFFNGQRLFADDLTALEAFHRELRWLHNQSLHQPGVGYGFAVAGAKGDREVTIQPGYALDDLGREIVLTETRVEPVPPVADDGFGRPVLYDLTVAYPAESDLPVSETRESVCGGVGAVRLMERPIFCWARLGPPPDRLPTEPLGSTGLRDAIQSGRRIRLARAEVLNCKLEHPLSIAQRRNAKPPSQPYIACGASDAADWTVEGLSATSNFGYLLTKTVLTESAGFRTTPRYMAHITGSRQFAFNVNGVQFARMLDGFLVVDEAKSNQTQVTVQMLIPAFMVNLAVPANFEQLLKEALEQKNLWRVEWLGVEG